MTETYKPIKRDLTRHSRLQPRPVAKPGTALVLHREGQLLRVVWPTADAPDTEPGSESRWTRYDTAYEVDIGLHWLTWSINVPSQVEPYGFQVKLSFACTIAEPAKVVGHEFEDVRQVIEPVVIKKMKEASRTCSVERIAEAEKAIAESLEDSILWEGFKLNNFIVNVSPDAAAREHLQKQEERRQDDQRRAVQAQRKTSERKEEREELQTNVKFYARLLQDPAASMWSVLLAQDPGTLPKLIERHNHQIDERQKLLTNMLYSFMGRNDIEPYQREQGLRLLWEQLMTEFQDSTQGFPSRNPPAMPTPPDSDSGESDGPANGKRPNGA